ncbi:MAG: polysaccharide deacetylase family protein [Crocinitomicaceae bacterium]|nr:polysaccharide deacetylase family protein [Crocinitomicaceae bacterium]MDG1777407.1 polysaccharide deacetylase family protein [Crocinitomicaceae bacterium]
MTKITPRIEYTFEFIFKARGVDVELTTDKVRFLNYPGTRLNYSRVNIAGVQINPGAICFEEGCLPKEVSWSKTNPWECLSIDGVVDPVASIFYLLSRYEEYTCVHFDVHGRFPFNESILSIGGNVEKANCDRWANQINRFIDSAYVVGQEVVDIIPTFDIDNTFAYKLKTGRRMILSLVKDVFLGNKTRIKERSEVLNGKKDPYDTFDEIIRISTKFPGTLLFWLVGRSSKKDRNISVENKGHQDLIKSMTKCIEVNLHPSYASNGEFKVIEAEKEVLTLITGAKITKSRQHFLKFQLPTTYRSLINAGFSDDYSMGFAEHVGFRSGTARPHYWFDLSTNEQTSLVIHPFIYMDGTLNEYMNLSIEQSKSRVSALYQEVLEFGGDFSFIWHNETIGDYGKWHGWSSVLTHTLKLKK